MPGLPKRPDVKYVFCPGIDQAEVEKMRKRIQKLIGKAIKAHYNSKDSTLVFGPIPPFGSHITREQLAQMDDRYAEFDNIGEGD